MTKGVSHVTKTIVKYILDIIGSASNSHKPMGNQTLYALSWSIGLSLGLEIFHRSRVVYRQ